jgi:tetratricopeptide (TPR) repeat protein
MTKLAERIEKAFADMLASEIPVEQHLALDLAKLDESRFHQLQVDARTVAKGDVHCADALVKMCGHLPSAFARATTLAYCYYAAKEYGRAIDWSIKALEVAPYWDHDILAAILSSMGEYLCREGEVKLARQWAERSLQYNPYFPYSLSLLVEVCRLESEQAKAEGYNRWLKQHGFDTHCWPPSGPSNAAKKPEPFEPRLEALVKRTDWDVFRVMVSQQHLTNRNAAAKHMNLALVLAGAGRYPEALFACLAGATRDEADYGPQLALLARDLEQRVEGGTLATIRQKRGLFHPQAGMRIAAIKQTNAPAHLWWKVFDPEYDVSLHACERLLVLGVRQELRPYLDLAKELEDRTGKSILHHGGVPKPHHLAPIASREPLSLRGTALVDQVIDHIRQGKSLIKVAQPQPIAKEILDGLQIADGVPLPPSLRRFLAFDAAWLGHSFGLLTDGSPSSFVLVSVAEALGQGLGRTFARYFEKLPAPLPQAECLALDVGSDTMRVLFLAQPDGQGEYPVLDLDVDDWPTIRLAAAGFDLWLAVQSGLIGDPAIECQAAAQECAQCLFGGKVSLPCEAAPKQGGRKKASAGNDSPPGSAKPGTPYYPYMAFAQTGLSLSYRGSPTPQVLRIAMTIPWPPHGTLGDRGPSTIETLLDALNRGVAGGATFDPAAGKARLLSGPKYGRKVPKACDYDWQVEVAGLCPKALRLLIEELARASNKAYAARSLTIEGALPPDGSEMSVTTPQMLKWLEQPEVYPGRWPNLPFELVERTWKKHPLLKLTAAGPVTEQAAHELEQRLETVKFFGFELPATSHKDKGWHDEVKLERKGNLLTVGLPKFSYDSRPFSALIVNMLVRYHAEVAALVRVEMAFP